MAGTITQEIDALKSRVNSAYDAVSAKGGTIPAQKTTANLPSAIKSIPSGGGTEPKFWNLPLTAVCPSFPDRNPRYAPSMYHLESPSDVGYYGAVQPVFSHYFSPALIFYSSSNSYPNISSLTYNTPILQIEWNDAFRENKKIEEIQLNKTTSIAGLNRAFKNCTNLRKVTINGAASTGKIGSNGFYWQESFANCTNLSSLSCTQPIYNGSLLSTFQNCTSLSSIDIPCFANMLCCNATYYGCSSLTAIPPLSTTYVTQDLTASQNHRNFAYGCSSLKHFEHTANNIPIGGLSAWHSAFQNCTSLESAKIRIGNINSSSSTTLSVLGGYTFQYAFYNCPKLTELSIYFLYSLASAYPTHLLSAIDGEPRCTVTFPETEIIRGAGTTATSLLYIARAALGYNPGVKEMYFPKLKTILTYCIFNGDVNLTAVHFPASSMASITSSVGYATLWGRGAGNMNVYFDL